MAEGVRTTITPEQFVSEWGPDGLVRNNPNAFEGTHIPQAARDFLVRAGLPEDTVLQLSFERPEDELPRLWDAFHDRYDLPEDYNRYLAIGVGYVPIICLDEKEEGRVYAIDVAGHHPMSLMSSGVPQLAEALLAWRASVQWAEQNEPDDEEAAEHARQLENKLRRIDPRVMEDGSSYWRQALRDALI